MPPWIGMMWPSRLVPTPKGVTGIRRSFAIASTWRHLGRRGGVDDEVGAVRLVEAEVGGVEVALGVAVLDRVGAERLAQRLGDLVDASRSLGVRLGREARRGAIDRPAEALVHHALGAVAVLRLARGEELLVAADRLAEPLARSRARGGCSDRRARRGGRPRRRAAAARSPGNRSRGTPSADGGSRSRSAPRRAAAGRAASPSSRRSPPCRTRGRRGSPRGPRGRAAPRRSPRSPRASAGSRSPGPSG